MFLKNIAPFKLMTLDSELHFCSFDFFRLAALAGYALRAQCSHLLDICVQQPVVAFPLSFLLAYIAVRTTGASFSQASFFSMTSAIPGETDINPIGAMGKVDLLHLQTIFYFPAAL
jgi:hypothetical protein